MVNQIRAVRPYKQYSGRVVNKTEHAFYIHWWTLL